VYSFRFFLISTLLLFLLSFLTPAYAVKTGDGVVPAEETVCDDDPFSFGLCNAYCEALDCDSDTPLGTQRACSRVLDNYMEKSDGIYPPCVDFSCPCDFDLNIDSDILLIRTVNSDLFAGTYECNGVGPNGEAGLHYYVEDADDPRLNGDVYYYFTEGPLSCNALVKQTDINVIEQRRFEMIGISETERAACEAQLQAICEER